MQAKQVPLYMKDGQSADDRELIRRLADRGLGALGTLFEATRHSCTAQRFAITRDERAAEDILQEAFCECIPMRARSIRKRALSPWLTGDG